VKLHVERQGAGADLVLLHGWGLHSGVWDEAIAVLARRYRVHAIDLPGHGHSAAAAVADFDAAVDGVAAAMPQASVVCGWSLGGLFAQRLAIRHPAKVAALALASTTPCFVERADWPHAMKAATLAAFAASLRVDRDATLENFVRLNALHGVRGREAMRAFAGRLSARGAAPVSGLEQALAWLRDVDLRAEVPRITQRALVIHGVRDALAPVAAGRWLAANLPAARCVELEDAAHLPFFTHPEPFVQSLESLVG
jgi:pimeloyl-[acyl-carrier protein] methyl ester esterase